MSTIKNITIHTECHDACGEPSTRRVTAEEYHAYKHEDIHALVDIFRWSKWDIRSHWQLDGATNRALYAEYTNTI